MSVYKPTPAEVALAKFHEEAANIPHSGRTLLDHLKGTAAIIERCPTAFPYVVSAGMHHSAYGTVYFGNVPKISQNNLRTCIGFHAERLVDFFCHMRRHETFIDFEATGIPRLLMRDNTHMMVDNQTMRDLRVIEVANLLDMNVPLLSCLADSNVWKHDIIAAMARDRVDKVRYETSGVMGRRPDAYDLPFGAFNAWSSYDHEKV